MNKRKLLLLTLISFVLILLLATLMVQIFSPAKPPLTASVMQTELPAKSLVYYISANLSDKGEYDLALDLKTDLEASANLDFKILDSEGILQLQKENISIVAKKQPNLLIFSPLAHISLLEELDTLTCPTLTVGIASPFADIPNISYDDQESAELLRLHIMATQYNSASICVVSGPTHLSKNLLQAIRQETNGRHFVVTSKLSLDNLGADELNNYQLIILLENIPQMVSYLQVCGYKGQIATITSDALALSYLQDGKIHALVYRSADELESKIKDSVIQILSGNQIPPNTTAYQKLINIYNLNDYLQNRY